MPTSLPKRKRPITSVDYFKHPNGDTAKVIIVSKPDGEEQIDIYFNGNSNSEILNDLYELAKDYDGKVTRGLPAKFSEFVSRFTKK